MIKKIIEIFGKDASDSEIDTLVYSSDASNIDGKADLVVWPKTVEQIQKLIHLANMSELNIVPRGAGTSLVGGAVPNNSIVVDMSKMNKVLHFDPSKKTVVLEPGVVLQDLNNALEKFGLFFPVIPSSHKVCTIGGMVATNAVGTRALKYGRTQNWVKSLDVVDGTGKYFPVKNIDNFIGSEGILGIVVKIELKLTNILKNTTLDVFKYDKASEMMDKVVSLISESSLISLEFISKTASDISEKDESFILFAEFESEQGNIKDSELIDKIWKFRESIGQLLSAKGYSISEDPKIPLGKMIVFLEWLQTHEIPSFGHIGIGVIHPRFKERSSDLIKEMFELVNKLNGDVTGEHGIGISKKDYIKPETKKRFSDLKEKYDPKNIMNKDKIL